MNRLLMATRNTVNGLIVCARSEAAFRLELVVLLIALPLACFVATSIWRWVMLTGVILLILVVELLNTGLEKLADHVTLHPTPAIGRVKDMGSAAVGISILLAALVWLVALAERLGLI